MNKSTLLEKGFKEVPNEIGNARFTLDIGLDRSLTIRCFGTTNESMFIDQKDKYSSINFVCLREWAYDGLLTEEKLDLILSFLRKP